MKTKILIFYFVSQIWTCLGQSVYFDKHYEFGTWSAGYSMINIQDSLYVIAGSNDSLVGAEERYSGIIIRTDGIGNTLTTNQFITTDTAFQQLFNTNSSDQLKSIIRTPDNNILAIGQTQSNGAINYYDLDLLLIKLDFNLDTLWTKSISHPGDTAFWPNQIINTSDSGFLICGWQNSFVSPNVRAFLCKVDSVGNLLWRKSYSNIFYTSTFWSVVETLDHGFICSGSIFDISFDGHASLFKVDSTGNFVQTLYSTLQSDTYGSRIIPTIDGNYLWTSMRSDGATNFMNDFIKLDNTGTILWQKQFCLYREGGPMAILQNYDGTYMMAGANGVPNQTGLTQGILMKLDANGDSLWSRLFQLPSQHGWFYDVSLCNDGGYVMCGETYCCNFTPGVGNTSSMWLVRTDSLGLLTGFNEFVDVEPNSILGLPYPNPAKDYFEVNITIPDTQLPEKSRKGVELLLFDNIGKQIASQMLPRGMDKARFEMSKFATGNYLVVLSIDGYNAGSRKIVKL